MHHSDFFKKALRGDWQEAKKSEIHMPEADPEVFTAFARWIHLGEPLKGCNVGGVADLKKTEVDWGRPESIINASYDLLIATYVFADKCSVPVPKMPPLISSSSSRVKRTPFLPNSRGTDTVYKSLLIDSFLRRLLQDIVVCKCPDDGFGSDSSLRHELPQEFLVDVTTADATRQGSQVRRCSFRKRPLWSISRAQGWSAKMHRETVIGKHDGLD